MSCPRYEPDNGCMKGNCNGCFYGIGKAMTELEINQIIHEAMGKCWHEWYSVKELQFCSKCNKKVDNYFSADFLHPNPSYTSSWEAYGKMLEWAMTQEWWRECAYDVSSEYDNFGKMVEPIEYEFKECLLNPLTGSTVIAKLLKEYKINEK